MKPAIAPALVHRTDEGNAAEVSASTVHRPGPQPSMARMSTMPTACPKCGVSASGRFCSQCGASLSVDSGSVGQEIKSKFSAPLLLILGFVKPVLLLLTRPAAFCQAWLKGPQGMAELPFPLARFWRGIAPGRQDIMAPFKCLALAIGLIAAVGGVEQFAWRASGQQRVYERLQQGEERGMQEAARRHYGHAMKFVDLGKLTGFGLLDSALKEAWNLVGYLAFAIFAAAFMPRGGLVHRRAVEQYFAYAVATGLCVQVVARTLGALLFVPIAQNSLHAALNAANFLAFFGYLPLVWLGAIAQIVYFPRVLGIGRTRIAVAMLGGLAVMGVLNVVMSQLMFRSGIVLI